MTIEKLGVAETRGFLAEAQQNLDVEPGLCAFVTTQFLTDGRRAAALFGGDFRDADRSVSSACAASAIDVVWCASLDANHKGPGFRLTPTHENLAWVRTEFLTPSYVVADPSFRLLVVSDSDYYWAVASKPATVARISEINASLEINEDDIRPFCESDEPHDRLIGLTLSRFHEICQVSRRR